MAQNDDRKVTNDPYARGSFTFRRMTKGQVQAISIASAVIVVALILYALL